MDNRHDVFYDGSPILVASSIEVEAMFPAWQEVADAPYVIEFPNPFTGEIDTLEKWDLKHLDTPIQPNPSDKLRLDHLPHTMFYGLTIEH